MDKIRSVRDMHGADTNDVVYGSFGEFARDVYMTELSPTDVLGARKRLDAHEIRTYMGMNTTKDEFLEMERRTASGMSEAVPADGGFLLAPQWARQIILRAYQESAVLRRVTEWTVSDPNRNALVVPTVDETSRKDGSRFGGARSYWANEADTVTASKPKFANLELTPKKMIILSYLTNELLADMSFGSIASVVPLILSKELAFRVQDAVVMGDGNGKPQGIFSSPAKITFGARSGSNLIGAADVLGMLARFWVGSRTDPNGNPVDGSITQRQKPCWLVHSDSITQISQCNISVGSGGSLAFLYNPETGMLMGMPVIPIEQCAALGTEGDIILADISEYYLAWRSRGQLDVSMHLKFTTDEQAMRLTARVDGAGSWSSAVTPLNGASTQSPFVTLHS